MRKLRPYELIFITRLLDRSYCNAGLAQQLDSTAVEGMDDGGDGKFVVFLSKAGRVLGEGVAYMAFVDEDGVCVIATLSVDNFGDLFELDV